ncbi:MAG: twin-arginine translocase TatA/TatE family subunit [Myxococcota bacterium]
MFGIGTGEMLIIALVVLLAVGPSKMPVFMKTVGKGVRDLRKATRDLREQSGIDELLREDDPLGVRGLRRDLAAPVTTTPETSPRRMSAEDLAIEQPHEAVDLLDARARAGKRATEARVESARRDAEARTADAADDDFGAPVAREDGFEAAPEAAPSEDEGSGGAR